ncbi:MAG TPA: hypothetical protein VFC78_13800 [Tepidisphaeraceae bacterium]|nr:hypothetical protein [Tepidisphaeraceae bacterium]
MKHGLLYGSYELTIDDKNRLLIPSEVRKAFVPDRDGEAFFLIVGVNRKPWLYAEKYYENLVSDQQSDISPGEDSLAFDQMNFAMTSRVEWDKQGRIVVPDKTLKRTAINKDVTLIGAKDHLELWNRNDWNARENELDQKRGEVALRARLARQTSPKE